jgi:poly-gamma-glutamate synthesis protein (capsule biosynthesis protein)
MPETSVRDRTVALLAVGDSLGTTRLDGDPFQAVSGILPDADLRFMNLETVLTEESVPVAKKWIHIRTDPEPALRWLRVAGIDVVNLAHNHIQDYGVKGFNDTLNHLTHAKIATLGAGTTAESSLGPTILRRNGLKVGFVGFYEYRKSDPNAGIFITDISRPDEVVEIIQGLRERCDLIVVSLHWGAEHMFHPSPEQIAFARRLVDNGAHLILGHHSHCFQGVESYKHGLIAYSLGNFNFWQWDVETKWFNRLSAILRVGLTCDGVSSYELLPIWVNDRYCPVPIQDEEQKRRAFDHFDRLSRDIVTGAIRSKDWYEDLGPIYLPQTLKSFMITIRRYGLTRVKPMLRWMVREHTLRAMAGSIRACASGRPTYRHQIAPIVLDEKTI